MSDNELIAEFMGAIINKQEYGGSGAMNRNWSISHPITKNRMILYGVEMLYDSSWDWLMPVVEKINELDDNGQLLGIDYDVLKSMQDWIVSVNINNAYGDLISIIKWYNAQPK